MKNLILSIVFACYSLFTNAQPGMRVSMGENPGTNLIGLGLKGHVKEIIEVQYIGRLNEVVVDTSKLSIKKIMRFDPEGNEVEELQYGRNDRLLSKCSYGYTDPKAIVVDKFVQDTVHLGKYVFVYDDMGKIKELDIFPRNAKTAIFKTLYKYDKKGNKEEEISFVGLKNVMGKVTYRYNNQNKKIEQNAYDDRGNLLDKTTFDYDNYGNSTETGTFEMRGMVQVKNIIRRQNADRYGNWQFTTTERKSNGMLGDNLDKAIIKRIIIYY